MRDLERELSELGKSLVFPPVPELAATVRARLPERAAAAPLWPRRLAVVLAVVGVALIAGLAIPQARSAIFRVFGIGAVRIEYVDRLPAVRPGLPLELGTRISEEQAPFPLRESPLLGKPDGVYVSEYVVTFLYGTPTDVRLLVTQIDYPALGPEIVKKVVGTTTNTRVVAIEGSTGPAVWIEGAPHVLALPDAPERLAKNTLVWTMGDYTLRLEGAASLDEAVRIAESFR